MDAFRSMLESLHSRLASSGTRLVKITIASIGGRWRPVIGAS